MARIAPSDERPAVVCISSHVARGTVGNRAVAFALETLGYPVWAVPTVTLPWHAGHGPATRLVPPREEFTRFMEDLGRAPWIGEVGAVLTGSFGDPDQIEPVARFIETVKRVNSKAIFLCDPVLGDGERLCQPKATVTAIAERLIPLADVATPNRFELEVLTGLSLADNGDLAEAAQALGPAIMLVTSAFAMLRGGIGNLLIDGEILMLAEHRTIENPPNGLGDLTAAVFLARLLGGLDSVKALQSTTAAVFEILARTTKRGSDELTLETDADSLRRPMAMVHSRRLAFRRTGA